MRWYHRIGIGFLDLMILSCALIAIYFEVTPTGSFGLLTLNALEIMLAVIVLYVLCAAFTSFALMYMQEQNAFAKALKTLVSTVVTVALFGWILLPALWFLGYSFSGDVENVLIIASIIRGIVKIWLRRYFERGSTE